MSTPKPHYSLNEMQNEIKGISKTLEISKEEFEKVMSKPAKQHTDFKIDRYYLLFKKLFY